ncbi:unnamed protein product, partial [marine sediment metagenome]
MANGREMTVSLTPKGFVKAMPTDITRAQELVYELKIEQVMTREVITIAPDSSMGDLKELLRV